MNTPPVTTHRLVRLVVGTGVLGALAWLPAAGLGEEARDAASPEALRLAAAPPVAAPAAAPPGTISMDLADARLEEVLKLLSQQAGMNFIASGATRDRRVTVYLDRVPIKTAIRSLLDANNLSARTVDGSNVYVVTESGGRLVKLLTKVYTLKFARVVPTLGETSATFGNTGSLLQTTF
ncbi:MAG: hypothetical protein HY600_01900, partial [Candidatus Omnitrophica bacterium]|nr:hypothetical protein [Candidatus Omnitrophota bacterium]